MKQYLSYNNFGSSFQFFQLLIFPPRYWLGNFLYQCIHRLALPHYDPRGLEYEPRSFSFPLSVLQRFRGFLLINLLV